MSEHIYSYEEHEHCLELLSSLGEYVDGTLSQDLCSMLEGHLKNCQRCRIVVNTLKKTVELYQETDADPAIPDDVRRRLFLKLNLDDYLK